MVATKNASSNLCDNCHQRPKFGTHDFCGQYCAAEATKQCDYCHQKPKFGQYQYCGKQCAAADAALKTRTPAGFNPSGAGRQGNTGVRAHSSPGGPQMTSMQGPQHVVPKAAQSFAKQSFTGKSAGQFANLGSSKPSYQQAPGPQSHHTGLPGSYDVCAIQGCGQPVYTDSSGQISEYCSMTHREEAVNLGLADPCIMCGILPQTQVDYFCGQKCRDQALSK